MSILPMPDAIVLLEITGRYIDIFTIVLKEAALTVRYLLLWPGVAGFVSSLVALDKTPPLN